MALPFRAFFGASERKAEGLKGHQGTVMVRQTPRGGGADPNHGTAVLPHRLGKNRTTAAGLSGSGGRRHQSLEDGLLAVETILGLLVDQASGAVQHGRGDLLAPVSR